MLLTSVFGIAGPWPESKVGTILYIVMKWRLPGSQIVCAEQIVSPCGWTLTSRQLYQANQIPPPAIAMTCSLELSMKVYVIPSVFRLTTHV